MKTKLSLIISATTLAAVSGSYAQTAVTDPVGYITHPINAAVSATIPSVTLVAATLVNKTDFAAVTVNAGGTASVEATGATAGLDESSYLEIKSGPNEGWWSTIQSSTAGTITTKDALPASAGAGTSFIVRKHMTILGLMGANAAGLDTGTGTDNADEVQILDSGSTPQAVRSYFYATGADGAPTDGWFDPGGGSADNVAIVPGTAVQVVRKLTSGASMISVGHVKTTKTQIDVFTGTNWIAPMRATGVTLGASGFNTGVTTTGVLQGTSTADADEIQFLLAPSGGSQALLTFFAADAAATGASGFFDPGTNPQDDKNVPEYEGVILSRKSPTAAILTVPAVTIAP